MVAIAFWLFVLAAVGQVFYGVLALTVSPETARTQSSTAGDNPGRIDLTLQALTVLGFVLVLGAVIVGGLSWRIRRGDPRARRAMVALCVPLVLVELGAFYLRLGVSILLPVVLIVASVLLFRPAADEWSSPAETLDEDDHPRGLYVRLDAQGRAEWVPPTQIDPSRTRASIRSTTP